MLRRKVVAESLCSLPVGHSGGEWFRSGNSSTLRRGVAGQRGEARRQRRVCRVRGRGRGGGARRRARGRDGDGRGRVLQVQGDAVLAPAVDVVAPSAAAALVVDAREHSVHGEMLWVEKGGGVGGSAG